MCGPVAAGLAVAGGLFSASSAISQGNSAAKTAGRQAGYLNQQANQTLQQGAFQSDQALLQGQQAVGAERAGYAAGGIDVNSGTAQQVQDSSKQVSELDALTIKNNASLQAWGYQTQAAETIRAGKAAQKSARNQAIGALIGGATGAGKSLLTSGSGL